MNTSVNWPNHRLYFAVLEVPGYRRSGPVPAALLVELQQHMPVDVSELHAVAVPLTAGDTASPHTDRLLVCAARRDELASMDQRVTSLSPLDVPAAPELRALSDADLRSLNLLVGEFEPRPVKRARLRRHLELAAAVLIVAGLVCIGLYRREAALLDASARAQSTLDSLLAIDGTSGPALRPEHETERLHTQILFASHLRQATTHVSPPSDVTPALAGLLRAWPTDIPEAGAEGHLVQSISVNDSIMTVSFVTVADPTRVVRTLMPPNGWRLEEPRLSTVSGTTRVLVELRRIDREKGGS